MPELPHSLDAIQSFTKEGRSLILDCGGPRVAITVLMPRLVHWFAGRDVPLVPLIAVLCLQFTAAGCAIGEGILIALGVEQPAGYWRSFLAVFKYTAIAAPMVVVWLLLGALPKLGRRLPPIIGALLAGAIAVIASGLAPGDRVVTAGQYRVQPGAPVQVATANSQMPPAKLDATQQHVAQGARQ